MFDCRNIPMCPCELFVCWHRRLLHLFGFCWLGSCEEAIQWLLRRDNRRPRWRLVDHNLPLHTHLVVYHTIMISCLVLLWLPMSQSKVDGKPVLSKSLHTEGERGLRLFGYEPERSVRASGGYQCAEEHDPSCPKAPAIGSRPQISRTREVRKNVKVSELNRS